jgi:hypothetical protein
VAKALDFDALLQLESTRYDIAAVAQLRSGATRKRDAHPTFMFLVFPAWGEQGNSPLRNLEPWYWDLYERSREKIAGRLLIIFVADNRLSKHPLNGFAVPHIKPCAHNGCQVHNILDSKSHIFRVNPCPMR